MKLISHRGNIDGKNPEMENHPDYIKNALNLGYDVEIDIWSIKGKWHMGHDEYTYNINLEFLNTPGLWLHAKNHEAFFRLSHCKDLKYFWHQNDDFALTSNGYIWTYPGKTLNNLSIAVLPEIAISEPWYMCYGICSDYIEKYKEWKTK